MAYVDPNSIDNPTTGNAILASWGDTVRDDLDWLSTSMPHARVYNSAAISHATSGSNQIITFNSERYDTGSCHSTVSNTSRLTVPSGGGGVYSIGGCVGFLANATGVRYAYIVVNGATTIALNTAPATSAIDTRVTVACDYLLAAGDYVELGAYQNSGGALNMTATGNMCPEFWFRWVAVS